MIICLLSLIHLCIKNIQIKYENKKKNYCQITVIKYEKKQKNLSQKNNLTLKFNNVCGLVLYFISYIIKNIRFDVPLGVAKIKRDDNQIIRESK